MTAPAHALPCGASARSSFVAVLLILALYVAGPRPCACGAVRGDPPAAAATTTASTSAARFAALPTSTQSFVSDVVSMLHGGLPTHSGYMLAQLHGYAFTNEVQLDASSAIFAVGMVAAARHNALHHNQPAMQWHFQQYSSSIHWLRRLRGGMATAADKALLGDATYSSRYPAGLYSDWSQVRQQHPFHAHEVWICPTPRYHDHIEDLWEALQKIPEHVLPDLRSTMVVDWQGTPQFDSDGKVVGVDLDVRLVDIDNPAGPACDGCQPYSASEYINQEGEWEGDADASSCSGVWEEEQQRGKAAGCGGADAGPGWSDGTHPFVTDYYPGHYANEPAPWHGQDWSDEESAAIMGVLLLVCMVVATGVWVRWRDRGSVGVTTREKALRAQKRHQQQIQQQEGGTCWAVVTAGVYFTADVIQYVVHAVGLGRHRWAPVSNVPLVPRKQLRGAPPLQKQGSSPRGTTNSKTNSSSRSSRGTHNDGSSGGVASRVGRHKVAAPRHSAQAGAVAASSAAASPLRLLDHAAAAAVAASPAAGGLGRGTGAHVCAWWASLWHWVGAMWSHGQQGPRAPGPRPPPTTSSESAATSLVLQPAAATATAAAAAVPAAVPAAPAGCVIPEANAPPTPSSTSAAAAAAGGPLDINNRSSSSSNTDDMTSRDQRHQHQEQQHTVLPAPSASTTVNHHHHHPDSSTNHHDSSSTQHHHHSSSTSATCRVCGVARGPGVKLFKCSKCAGGTDRYCSGVCFKVDWPRHKLTCCRAAGVGASPGK